MRLLAIDPGVRLHGWCVLLCHNAAFSPTQWVPVACGHDPIDAVAAQCAAASVVAVETPAGHAYSAARVKGLLDAAGAAGELRGLARASGARVVSCSAETWRAALVGTAQASDQQIAERLSWEVKRGTLSCLPETRLKSERPHVLDACGLALVVATRGVDWVEAREAERRGQTKRQETLPGLGTKRRAKR